MSQQPSLTDHVRTLVFELAKTLICCNCSSQASNHKYPHHVVNIARTQYTSKSIPTTSQMMIKMMTRIVVKMMIDQLVPMGQLVTGDNVIMM